jgi:hypothetical protein
MEPQYSNILAVHMGNYEREDHHSHLATKGYPARQVFRLPEGGMFLQLNGRSYLLHRTA